MTDTAPAPALGALDGVRVLDLTRVFAGPWATQMLADFGADVVKVEHPAGGDDVRRMGMPQLRPDGTETGQASSFLAMNRNKRSVALDMGKPAGQAALRARDMVTGRGQHIDIALLDTQVAAHSHIAMNYLVGGQVPVRAGTASQINTPWQAFPTRDVPIMVAVGNDRQFAALCAALEIPEVSADPRFATNRGRMANREALLPILSDALAKRGAEEWFERLNRAGVSSGPLHDFAAVVADPQVVHRGLVREMPDPALDTGAAGAGTLRFVANPVRFSDTPVRYERVPPRLGEHGEEVLREWIGMDDASLAAVAAETGR